MAWQSAKNSTTYSSGNKVRRFRIWKRLAILTMVCCLIVICGLVSLLLYLRSQTLPAFSSGRVSQIVDIGGNVIDTLQTSTGGKRQPVKLGDVSPDLIRATLAIEDRSFYNHIGFDFKGMARATLVNLQRMDKVQGASTLTQQLARNLFLSHERTWSRKMKEAAYTVQLEMNYTKDEILEMYLNQIYYGHGAYGIEAASRFFFGKHAKELTLAESAMLAGIPKGPKYYSPHNDMKNAKDRQKTILQAMVDCGYITREQADEAYGQILSFQPLQQKSNTVTAPYFRDYVKNVAVDTLGIEERLLEQGGLTIYTTLDLHAQQAAEEAVAKYLPQNSELQAALVSVDPRNGYIKAMVGGKDYKQNQFNRALATTRQPGSSFKPIMYLAALQSGEMTSVTHFKSEPTIFRYDNNRKTYQPSNHGGKYYGEIDMRQAIAASDNIYAVNTIMKIGPDKVIDMARSMGIESPLQPLPSLALGTFPVSPLEMASAFGVISNQGVRAAPTAILKIVDADGKVLYEAPQPRQERVIDPAYTYVLTNLMESVFEAGGTGNRVSSLMKRPVAGKTGTTDTDAWLVGFTPELSTSVWLGYDKDKTIAAAEAHQAAPIFAEFTERALENVPPKIFPIPEGVVTVYIDPETGKLATAACPGKRMESFVEGTEPTEYCAAHQGTEPEEIKPTETEVHRSWWKDLKRWWNG